MKTDASGFPENVRRPGIPNPATIVTRQVKVMAMKVSKGLEFPVVALPGVGHMPAAGEDEKEAARGFYVAATRATRATQRLVVGVAENAGIGGRLEGPKPRELESAVA